MRSAARVHVRLTKEAAKDSAILASERKQPGVEHFEFM